MSTAHTGWAVGGTLMAVAIAAATTWSAGVHSAPASRPATSPAVAPAASSGTSASTPAVADPATAASASASAAAASAAEASAAAAAATGTTSEKVVPPAMSPAQAATTNAELAAVARRLTRRVALTPPATWAQYAGTTPEYAEDVTSCPHVSSTLGAELGEKWTYAYGKLPTGPVGCTWTPVPWVPDRPPADRLFVSIGYQAGPVADLLHQPGYCAGGSAAPTLAVPAVGSGAALDGCLDANGTQLGLSVADPAGTGVWTLAVSAGSALPVPRAAEALVAVVDSARKAYA